MGEQLRLNIFHNPHIESYIASYRIAHEDNMRKNTEEFWRGRIALEILESCVAHRNGGKPCDVCTEEYEYIILRGKRKRTF